MGLSQCCASRNPDEIASSKGIAHFGSTLTDADNEKFNENLRDKYKFYRIDFSTFGG